MRLTPAEQAAALITRFGGPVAAAKACGMRYESLASVAASVSRCGNPNPQRKTLVRIGLDPDDCVDGRYAVLNENPLHPDAALAVLRRWKLPLAAVEVAEDCALEPTVSGLAAAHNALVQLERQGVAWRQGPYWCAA